MAGMPWEKYATATQAQPAETAGDGPWSKYSAPKVSEPAAPAGPEYVAPHNAIMGALNSAAGIGSNIMRVAELNPLNMIKNAVMGREQGADKAERDASIKQFFGENANPESIAFKGGELLTDIAGTAGVPGMLGKGAQIAGASPKIVAAIESGGFKLGSPAATTLSGKAADAALRVGGGAVAGGASAGLANPEDAAIGAGVGAALPPALKVAGAAGNLIGSGIRAGSERLMQSALKPSIESLKSGDAAIAVKTLLDEGISPTMAGVSKIQSTVSDINDEIADLIKASGSKIDKKRVINALSEVRSKFGNQVNPEADLAVIEDVAQKFANHPKLQNLNAMELAFKEAFEKAQKARVSALQDAGRFETMAAQQRQLGKGRPVELSPQQTANTPYFNVGATGGQARSMRDIAGHARPAERYAPNDPRIAEAESAALDAKRIAGERAFEAAKAKRALEEHLAAGGSGIPVQLAQDLKQGTYRVLKGKYGEAGSAETEAQKALARGLKEGIAEAVPGVAKLNARESALLKTLDVAERRALMEANKNTMGLAALAGNPVSWAVFMADRSAAFKALAARMANRAAEASAVPVRNLGGLLEKPAARAITYQSGGD